MTFEGNHRRCVFVSKCSSSIQFDHVCPLPTAVMQLQRPALRFHSRGGEESAVPPFSMSCCSVLITGWCSMGQALCGEASSPRALALHPWGPAESSSALLPGKCQLLRHWTFKLNPWLNTRVRNHEKEYSLLYLLLSLAVFFKWLSCAKRYKLLLKQFLSANVTFPPLITLSSDER